MRIIYLHQYFVTPAMSGGTRSYEMARRLVAAGHEVHMITTDQRASGDAGRDGWRETDESGIRVHWTNVAYRNDMSHRERITAFVAFALRAARRAVRLKGDVVFATSTPLTVAVPGLIASTWLRVPFVFEVRDMWPDVPIAIGALRNPLAKWLARQLEHLAYSRASHVVALAPGMRDDIIAKGIPSNKVSVIPNGCDLDVFGKSPDSSPREQYPWLADRTLVLFAGSFGAVNGVEYLVHLAAATAQLDPEVRFVLIGSGREFEYVRALALRLGVLNHSFFMFDAVSKAELSRWIYAADMTTALFTGPRVIWKDAVQNKFFDALAAGRPVASNFSGWQSEVAVAEGVGLILDSFDPAHAARTLLDALGDVDWIANARRRARELAAGRFNRDRLAAQLEAVLVQTARRARRQTGR